jgi:hypothetical protein
MRLSELLFRTLVAAVAVGTFSGIRGQQSADRSVASIWEQAVYAWLPDNSVVRLSPGRGLFVQAHVHPEGTSALFWGGVEGHPHVWFHSTIGSVTTPYRFNPITQELRRFMPPGFTTAGHITRARNNTITFDSIEIDPWEKR